MLRTPFRSVFAAAVLLGAASAQTINWGPASPSVSPSDVSVAGALVYAVNYHHPNITPIPATVNGEVTMVWGSLAVGANTTTMVVGGTPAGAGSVPALVDFATAAPFLMGPPVSLAPMAMSASPARVINPSTNVTYTISNIPEFAPNTGVYLSTLFLSVTPLTAGIDLAGLLTQQPGCKAYIGTLDLDLGVALTGLSSSTRSVTFSAPLLNGEAGGLVVSNGVLSVCQLQ
jgi:hypothetical protein